MIYLYIMQALSAIGGGISTFIMGTEFSTKEKPKDTYIYAYPAASLKKDTPNEERINNIC